MTSQVKTFFQLRLQKMIANILFPSNSSDWYASKGYKADAEIGADAFDDFITKQSKPDSQYYKEFQNLNWQRDMVSSQLVSGDKCQLEVMRTTPDKTITDLNQAGNGKHIVYFPGADTYYQACFRDISAAAKETGATIHAFNFPGTGASTGKVLESNDLINAGIAVVNDLIKQGVHIDDIILQGDCVGSAIANEVKNQFKEQSNMEIRVIMNNAFGSFESAVKDMITNSTWLPAFLKNAVRSLLAWTGWDMRPEDTYHGMTPYQCHLQHYGDQTLQTGTLSDAVNKHQHQSDFVDPCPAEFKDSRNRLAAKHMARLKPAQEERLAKKFGRDSYGHANAHYADVCELELLNRESVYKGFVNDFIASSDAYISNHKQYMTNFEAPEYLNASHEQRELTPKEQKDFAEFESTMKHLKKFDILPDATSEEDIIPLALQTV